MSDVNWKMTVRARDGAYDVTVDDNAFHRLAHTQSPKRHVLIDSQVARLYEGELNLDWGKVLYIQAREKFKSIESMDFYADWLLKAGIRRDHEIIAIGGGVVQDIACFLAGTLLRGVPWVYYPTTLLAQADSCIGGKSSINVGRFKNAMGTFTPPRAVWIVPHVLDTLSEVDMRSGVGEMLKIHAIAGPAWFDLISRDYSDLFTNRDTLLRYIKLSLNRKRDYVEADEFDVGIRRLLNYGHTFGHAIESVTNYAVPHGIAVSLGMDIANHFAWWMGDDTLSATYIRMHPILVANCAGFSSYISKITVDTMLRALLSDKKNTGDGVLTLILPDGTGQMRECKRRMEVVAEVLRSYGFAEEDVPVCV